MALVGDNVYPIFKDHNGDTWIGTTTGFSHLHNGSLINYLKEPIIRLTRCSFFF